MGGLARKVRNLVVFVGGFCLAASGVATAAAGVLSGRTQAIFVTVGTALMAVERGCVAWENNSLAKATAVGGTLRRDELL
jgi:hypothetical protein